MPACRADKLRAAGRLRRRAAAAHLARALARRAERAVVQLGAEEPVGAPVLRFLNRLSDHLFVLARRLNAEAGGDVLWVPGANR